MERGSTFTYQVTCEQGHVSVVDLDEVEHLLDWDECPEDGCEASINEVDPSHVTFECPFCFWEDTQEWDEARIYVGESCPHCANAGGISTVLSVGGTFASLVKTYELKSDPINSATLLRRGRQDYWEVLIHFCNEDEIGKILSDDTIKASPTGYFGVPAVCLTETPLLHAAEIRKRHGDFGIAFKKSRLIRAGAAPAVYLPESIINAQKTFPMKFCDELQPFVNLIRLPDQKANSKFHDFLHEREWRIPHDISLREIKPLGLILPKGHALKKIGGKHTQALVNAALIYGEIE